jgi:hypothetical protein
VAGVLIEESSWEKAKRLLSRLETSQVLDVGYLEQLILKTIPRFQGGGGGAKYFILAEDANVTGRGYIYAKPAAINQTTGDIEESGTALFKLWNWQLILTTPTYAKAGYSGVCSSNNIFLNGPCIGGCQANGSIATGDIPAGEVDAEYSHTVTGTTIDETTIDVTGLPAGLTYDAVTQEISGTPTEAGTTLITVTADADNGCPITKIVEFVVTESP